MKNQTIKIARVDFNTLRGIAWIAVIVVFCTVPGITQTQTPRTSFSDNTSAPNDLRELQEQVRQLKTMVEEMRDENTQSRAEMQQLRHELQDTRSLLERPAPYSADVAVAPASPASSDEITSSTVQDSVQKLEDSSSLLNSKVDEQYQTKVETASKYRARLSGIVLMNLFRNHGASNNLDLPDYAQPGLPGASPDTFGATLRQSEIGLEIFGPQIAGAKTSGNLQFDFAGGFPATGNGNNFGIARLQTASLRLDWADTSLVAGQDALFLSPLSPTSFASLAVPAFAFAGNLWGWTPQVRIEHRFNLTDSQTLTVQAGILDNLDWEYPYDPGYFYRTSQAGELSGQPAYAVRTAWSHPLQDRPLTLGVAAYFGRQSWSANRNVDAWGIMADWQVPLGRRFTLSGEFYRGRGLGGLGAGVGLPILYGGDPASTASPIRGPESAGGWSQLKFRLTSKLEFNGVFSEDNAFATDIRGFASDQNNFGPVLGRNRGALANVIYRPRSDLLFSAEVRRLRTYPVYSESSVTNQINLAMGILF